MTLVQTVLGPVPCRFVVAPKWLSLQSQYELWQHALFSVNGDSVRQVAVSCVVVSDGVAWQREARPSNEGMKFNAKEEVFVDKRTVAGGDDLTAPIPGSLRHTMSHYVRGVCAVTFSRGEHAVAVLAEGLHAVGEHPPRVAILLSKSQAIAARPEPGQAIGINVLSVEQESLFREAAVGEGLVLPPGEWRAGTTGTPLLNRPVAWMDCSVDRIIDLDDLSIVLGDVASQGESSLKPLIGFRSGYGELTTLTLSAGSSELRPWLQLVDHVREEMEAVANELHCRVVVQAMVGDQIVFLASAGHLTDSVSPVMAVGDRSPVVPPMGALFVAWDQPENVERWVSVLPEGPTRADARSRLTAVRERGYSVYMRSERDRDLWRIKATGQMPSVPRDLTSAQVQMINEMNQDPKQFGPNEAEDVEWIAVPIFGPDSQVALLLGAEGLTYPSDWGEFEARLGRLEEAASRATTAIGGCVPLPPLVDDLEAAERPGRG